MTIGNLAAPAGVSVDPHSVWIASFGNNTLTKIDKASNSVTATINVGTHPSSYGDATGFAFKRIILNGSCQGDDDKE